MATIKVPYTYKEYKLSKWGTRVDKFCHSPSRIVWIFLVSMLLFGYFAVCFSAMHLPDAVLRVLGGLGAIFLLVSFIGSFCLGWICDRFKLSERVALWDISGVGITPKMKKGLISLGILMLLPGLIALVVTVTTTIQGNAYHKTMAALEDPDSVSINGSMAVTCEDSRFTRSYIPKSLQAEEPEEVRYILYCTDGEKMTGFYGASFVSGYQRWREVKIVDRKTGEVVAQERFYGSNPPHSISDDTKKDQYGSEPDEQEIRAWVKRNLPGA